MQLSSRIKETNESVTLKVNEKINEMVQEGKHVYNMTSGQLPFKPSSEFIKCINKQLNFLKSYQYSPISGIEVLRKKFLSQYEEKRNLTFSSSPIEMDCIISNGSKHSIYNMLGALINPGDEVILLTPYWVSYPEMIKFWGGTPIIVKSHAFDAYTPPIEEIEKAISPRTKAIIVNSPNNPAGIHYSEKWMKEFAVFMETQDELIVISDEIYCDISYFDPAPSYFYQYNNDLLKNTVIINGISKSLAATGLRIGYCIADKRLTKAMAKIQSQTTSGPNTLIQRALIDYDFNEHEGYFDSIKMQLRECAQVVREAFRNANLPHCYYQTTSGFYYLLDFSRMPIYEKYKDEENSDFSQSIVDDILVKTGVALVPGSAFGYPNSARMSMTLDISPFKEAMDKLITYVAAK